MNRAKRDIVETVEGPVTYRNRGGGE